MALNNLNPGAEKKPLGKVIVVDDEVELTNALVEMLNRQGYATSGFSDGNLALEQLRAEPHDVLLADLMMPEMDGISLVRAALRLDPNLVCILMTGQGTVQTAVEAMKSGAFDYILKPFKLNTILNALTRSLEVRLLRVENVQLRELVHLYELGQEITTSLEERAVFQKVADAALKETQADDVSVLARLPDGEHLMIAAVSGDGRGKLVGKVVPAEGTIAGWVMEHREMLTLQGRVNDSRFAPVYPRPEIFQSLSMPLTVGKNVIGVINVNITSSPRSLSQGQVTGLGILSSIAAGAMENSRLYEQTERRLHRLAALRAIDLAITSSLDLRVTLNILLEQVAEQLSGDAAAVLLLDPNSQALTYAAGRGFRGEAVRDLRVLLGEGAAGASALDRKTISIHDFRKETSDPALDAVRQEEAIRSAFFTPMLAKGEIKGLLALFQRQPFSPDAEWMEFFESIAGQAAIAIDSAQMFDHLQRSNQELKLAYNATIEGWSRALDLRDHETEGHTQRVTDMTLKLARAMNVFDEDDLVHLRRGALLHDIGKMGVPDEILLKPGDLNPEEEAVMRRHPDYAFQLLSPIPYLRKALDIPRYHHERWDGTGYPEGLKGESIPLAARIFSVVDVWDALRSDRPYRPGWEDARVLDHIAGLAGSHFDPVVVDHFLRLMRFSPGPG